MKRILLIILGSLLLVAYGCGERIESGETAAPTQVTETTFEDAQITDEEGMDSGVTAETGTTAKATPTASETEKPEVIESPEVSAGTPSDGNKTDSEPADETAPTETNPPAQETASATTSPPAQETADTETNPPAQETAEPEPSPSPEESADTVTDAKAIAMTYINQPVSALYAAIGTPISSDYAPSCLDDGEDGNLYYDGFVVYTYRDGDSEVIIDVE